MSRRDAGAVTAELAVALPAVVVVLAACVGGLRLAAEEVQLQDTTALAARSFARGDGVAAPAGVEITTWRDGVLACARGRTSASWAPALPPVSLTAMSCALADGR